VIVRTVLGDIDPAQLGPTYCHEHLLTRPAERFGEDMVLDDEDKAAVELTEFRDLGGRGLVELTTPELGRNPEGLRRLAERTGVQVVATTGHASEEYWRGVLQLDDISEAALAGTFVRDLTGGMDGTGIRAGIIKIGSSADELTEPEGKVVRAAAAAHLATGAPITTHTTAGTAAMKQIRALEKAGADLQHVCIGHLDRRLVWEEHLEIVRTGVFIGYDQISKQKYHPDAERIRFIMRLVHEGFGGQVCLSGDLARRSYLRAWGGAPGYRYILGEFLPHLIRAGLDEHHLRAFTVENPARLLTWVA
jgi:predicted metal-dependent phosphotriesterase family hydrolase